VAIAKNMDRLCIAIHELGSLSDVIKSLDNKIIKEKKIEKDLSIE